MPRTRKYDGMVYRRDGTQIWWIRYRDRKGIARRESSQTADWEEANKKLRERLLARDANLLEVIRKGETLTYGQWAGSFSENYSKPPMRAPGTHSANERCIKHLRLHLLKPDWWTLVPIQSTFTFANASARPSSSRPSLVASRCEPLSPRPCTRSSEFSGACSMWRFVRSCLRQIPVLVLSFRLP